MICWDICGEYVGIHRDLFIRHKHWPKTHIFDSQIGDSLERNDGNQFPVKLRVVSVGIHRHRFLFDSMKRRMTDLMQMFLQFGFRPESLQRFGAFEKWLEVWRVLVLSPDVVLQ